MIPAVMIDISPLLPQTISPVKSIVDILPKPKNNTVGSLLQNIMAIKMVVISLDISIASTKNTNADYEKYLQYPNPQVKALAQSIVSPVDTNDQKMYKIEQWVKNNIKYVSDIKQYGVSELWTMPTVTLNRGKGDCEDGAFLMHSLALHAGISPDRLRTYGGLVWADQYGATFDGHGWTAYKRESDNQWIVTDWCYWAKDTSLDQRIAMKSDFKYVDDFFWINVYGTTETPYSNAVRYAFMPKGSLLNQIT